MTWQPSASMATLRRRAVMQQTIRDFFAAREVLEVDTPILSAAAVADPMLEPMQTRVDRDGQARHCYLHTSPEYPMKRLLAAGSGAIWQLCRVFRNGEVGRRHNPEFSMLEWYRPGFDHHQLMDEVEALTSGLLGHSSARRVRYADVFAEHFAGLDIHACATSSLRALGEQHTGFKGELARDGWLDLLFSHCIEPTLQQPTFVYAYPASQAALARITASDDSYPVAARFEFFVGGMELANGYHELIDAAEQASRFAEDARKVQLLGQPPRPLDQNLLAALESGLPDCAGVALGFDRLLMLAEGAEHIAEVLAFPFERA
ncbi:EF-P lysine aminoacylase EpmA [Halopseudomonas salegens]|uniref:Lysyl-tRNA synthetase, class 2 n=1 Tax=Halopseudomonas salegens TaxID=1434072 RepID=A0A1H2GFC3_9GAMM|nr:EF-P lysine aminoacylase EpmA [Halopseudomonas salegens]SDU18219.1 lysyl-tRNA synthetase, class 2 [Halopseudomonas salegens]